MYITMAQASSDPGFTSLRGRPGRRSVKISTRDPCQTNCFFEVKMSERPEMITASYVPGGTAEVHVSLPGSASNSARSSGPSAADVIFASSKLGPADPLFFYAGGLLDKVGAIGPPPGKWSQGLQGLIPTGRYEGARTVEPGAPVLGGM